jgi:hypothetical protein
VDVVFPPSIKSILLSFSQHAGVDGARQSSWRASALPVPDPCRPVFTCALHLFVGEPEFFHQIDYQNEE